MQHTVNDRWVTTKILMLKPLSGFSLCFAATTGNVAWARGLCTGLTTDQSLWILKTMTRLVLAHASQYHRRVVAVLNKFPYQLLKLVNADSQTVCVDRQAVAKLLLATNAKQLDATTLKFRKRYEVDCAYAAQSGLLSHRLEIVLGGLKYLLHSDVRESERVNKQIKLILERAPSASTDLISSRVALKYYLGAAGAGQGHTRAKWSDYKPVAQKLQNECLAGWDTKKELTDKVDRFSAPMFSPEHFRHNVIGCSATDTGNAAAENSFWRLTQEDINKEYVRINPGIQTSGCKHAWAVCYNMQLSKKIQDLWTSSNKSDDDDDDKSLHIPVICFGSRKPTDVRSTFTAYMTVEKVRTSYMMIACRFDTKTKNLEILTPLTFHSSTDLIASHYDDVKSGATVGVFAVRLVSLGNADTYSLLQGSTQGVEKILQLKKATPAMEAKLEGLSNHKPSVDVASILRQPPSSLSRSSAELQTEMGSHNDGKGAFDADSDLSEGLNLLLQQELAKARKTNPPQGDDIQQKSGEQDVRKLLVHAISDFHHVPDDLELEEDTIADEVSHEICDDLVNHVEAALVNKVLDSGRAADEASVNEHIAAGLDLHDAISEAVLNTDDALGNFETEAHAPEGHKNFDSHQYGDHGDNAEHSTVGNTCGDHTCKQPEQPPSD